MQELPIVITAPVIHGRGLGHKLGTPTVNQALSEELIYTEYGVYFSRVTVDGVVYPAVSNVGVKPTVSDSDSPVCETHILDAELSVYGKNVKTELLFFHRPEKKFDSFKSLTDAINADTLAARKYFSDINPIKNE